MTDWIADRLARMHASVSLSVGEVLVVLLLASVIVLAISLLLAAAALLARRQRLKRARRARARFEAWRGELHRVLYDGAPPEALWDVVGTAKPAEFLDFLVQFVRRLEGAERRRLLQLAEPYLPSIVDQLGARDEGRRMRAIQRLGELGLPQHEARVVAALDDPSPLVAMVAANTLARPDSAERAAEVLARLDRFTGWRQDFLAALLASMGLTAADALRATLSDAGAPPRVRAIAADALAAIGDPRAAETAHVVLETAEDLELRAAALRLLASVGRGTHLGLVRRLVTAPALPVRLAAIRALGRFGLPTDIPVLESALKEDPSPWVAIAAARALKDAGGEEPLVALAGSDHPRAALGLQVISETSSW